MRTLKKCVAILILISITSFISCSKDNEIKELTMDEKVEDFNYLYKTIKENYPFLDVNKRVYEVDWLSKYNEFLERVSLTKSDVEFFSVLDGILRELNNGHTHMLNSEIFNVFRETYSLEKNSWQYKVNLPVLNNKKSLKRYAISNNEKTDEIEKYKNNEDVSTVNASAKDIVDKKIAYISIPMMISPAKMEEDMLLLDKYLEEVKNYQALVIDIRGNAGGDTRYWSDYLVPKIIDKNFSTVNYIFWKNGDIMKRFFDKSKFLKNNFVGEIKSLDISSLVNLPKEVTRDFTYYFKLCKEIVPSKESINFKGNIYLLIDEVVYSSAEAFASFAKNSNFATLIGERTGGDGLGSDPLLATLPNSSYVFRFSKDFGVDATGKCNEEYKTEPDYKVFKGYNEDHCIDKVLELENLK